MLLQLQPSFSNSHAAPRVQPRGDVLTGAIDAVHTLKEMFWHADQAAIRNDGTLPQDIAVELHDGFLKLIRDVERLIGDRADTDPEGRAELAAYLRRELLPFICLTEHAERMYSKPRGYAGDYYTIYKMYQDIPGGHGRLGAVIDRAFLQTPAALAVKNRRTLLARELANVVAKCDGKASIMSMACGPAQELIDMLDVNAVPQGTKFTLIDFDDQALSHVSKQVDQRQSDHEFTCVRENLVHLALGRKALKVAPQDVVYSIGLIDYFNDRLVTKLIDFAWSTLKPGGKLILGNFHPSNWCKGFMDHILCWRLIHRTEEDMHELFERSAFGRGCTRIFFEPENVNMFAECVK
jgi:extracellular factor (EF) 3-hydroxypalmitic acid methyl ester biosynthesis protein